MRGDNVDGWEGLGLVVGGKGGLGFFLEGVGRLVGAGVILCVIDWFLGVFVVSVVVVIVIVVSIILL